MKLKTYRNYLLFNKLLDLIIYLIVFTIVTAFSFMIYYTTKSFIILFMVMFIIYLVGLYIAKLFEIKVLLPSIAYLLVSFTLIILVTYFEQDNMNSELIEFALILLVILTIISLIITIYKYETPTSIYYKTKDFFSGVTYGKKIKTKLIDNKEPNTNTPYSTNLIFEKIKLINKLTEEYNEELNLLNNALVKDNENLKYNTAELDDLLENLNNINKRLSEKHTGAQDFELNNQKKELQLKIGIKKAVVSDSEIKVKTTKNNISELNDIYQKNQFYISNGYNMRYLNYCNSIKDMLSLSDFKLNVISFNELVKNLEGTNERFIK